MFKPEFGRPVPSHLSTLSKAPIPRFFSLSLSLTHCPSLCAAFRVSAIPSIGRMSHPIVLSDDEDRIVLDTPLPTTSKKRRTGPDGGPDPPVLILDDDPTPKKFGSSSTPCFVAETPYSDIAIVKCTSRVNLPDDPQARVSPDRPRLSGDSDLFHGSGSNLHPTSVPEDIRLYQ
ncbi:hypothetical protein CRG98_021263, partial [Punica granatum]